MSATMSRASIHDIRPRYWLIVATIILVMGAIELAFGRHAICTCGHVDLFHPALDAGNSQHLFDWYMPSHIIHGFLFYFLGWLLFRRASPGVRLTFAVAIEAAWEVLENSPIIIDRYREATIALGYTGDTVINSMSDVAAMAFGFAIARRIPWWTTVGIAIGFELLTLAIIRDNLTLNVLMLVAPVEAIRVWQAGA